MRPTTLEEVKNYDRDTLIADDIARVVGIDAMRIKAQAYKDPTRLGFPVIVVERTVRIPRKAFIAWMEGTLHTTNKEETNDEKHSNDDRNKGNG